MRNLRLFKLNGLLLGLITLAFVISPTSAQSDVESLMDRVVGRHTLENPEGGYRTRKVVIVSIDGLRDLEGHEDPTHASIPHLWNDLRPLGTLCTNMYTVQPPSTGPGHTAMVTGARMSIPNNNASTIDGIRPWFPTMSEYFRKETGEAAHKSWIISGKPFLSTCDYSTHPNWGPDYAGMVRVNVGSDSSTIQKFYLAAERDEPIITLLNLHNVDGVGHAVDGETYEDYLLAIQNADALVWELWQFLQTKVGYRDQTTMIVTTDHGRGFPDYRPHGLPGHHDRHVFCLIVGPDTKANFVDDTVYTHADLCPTVGELLDFPTPLAQGKAMTGTFVDFLGQNRLQRPPGVELGAWGRQVSFTSGDSLRPSVAVNNDGVHIAWSESDPLNAAETRAIVLRSTTDHGQTWSAQRQLMKRFNRYDQGGRNITPGVPMFASMVARNDGRLVLGISGYSREEVKGDLELLWGMTTLTQNDQNGFDERGFVNLGHTIADVPAIASDTDSNRATLMWVDRMERPTVGRVSDADGERLDRDFNIPALLEQSGFGFEYDRFHAFRRPAIASGDGFTHFLFDFYQLEEASLYYVRRNDNTRRADQVKKISLGSGYATGPRVVINGNTVILVWQEVVDGVWQIQSRASSDQGATFGPVKTISTSSKGAWNPDVVVEGSRIAVVWEDYRDGNGEIYARISTNGGNTFGAQVRLTANEGMSANPRAAIKDGRLHIAFEDDRTGNWEIYYLRY